MKIYILTTGVFICTFLSQAQNDIDAMRYSQITFGGTARFASMAGSMGALGGDISTLSFNPAGIAIFKKTEVSITPSIFSQTTSSTYNSNTSSDSKLNFNIGNIGIVASINLMSDKNTTGWESLNFGFGYNRTNNFHNRMDIQGDNKTSSLLDVFVANANGHTSNDFDGFSTDLAWQTYLFNPSSDSTAYLQYTHVVPNYGIRQRKSVETSGSMGETVLSFGGNYKSKIYLGGTIGLVRVRYNETSTYEETDEMDTIPNFKSFTFGQDLATSGNGVNLKLGAIIRPNDWLRVGVAVHTPTSLSLHDDYSSTMTSNLDGVSYDTVSPEGSFDYRITTPFRAIGSLGFIINKIAILNIDYEYIDYSYAQLHSTPNVFSDVNKTIRDNYTSTGNLRVGGEVRLDPIAIRVGYALYGSPFKANENKNATRSSYTAGIGYRQDHYFIDFAYVLTQYTEYNYLYDSPKATVVENKYKNSSFMLSLGFRF